MSRVWTRRNFLTTSGAVVAGSPLAYALGVSGVAAAGAPDGWGRAAEILRRVKPPRFPDRDFLITDYGAAGDGRTDCTGAIAAAIADCTNSGGGRVVVPAGTFSTGAIHLASNVNLHVTADATIAFVPDPSAYLPVVYTRWEGIELMNHSPLIYAYGEENIAITGSGTLDGQAAWENWWAWTQGAGQDFQALHQMAADGVPVGERVFGDGHHLRPNFIQPYRCRNVLIEGVTVVRSPMWQIHPVLCENVTVQDVVVESRGPNNDGVNPESCRYVVIRGCTFNAGDDCIAIKSGREADGLRVGVPSEDILIEQCEMNIRYGAVTIGSEMTGGVRNVFVRHCRFGSPDLYFGLYIKTNSHRGGFAENIYLNNISVSNVTKEFISCDFYRGEGDTGPLTPVVRNVELRNVRVGSARGLMYARGYPRSPIRDFRLVNCRFDDIWGDPPEDGWRTSPGSGVIENIELDFTNVSVNGERVSETDYVRA